MVSLPEEFLVQVDELAQVEHRSRSELIREAVQQYMETRQRLVRPGDLPEVCKLVEIDAALQTYREKYGMPFAAYKKRWETEDSPQDYAYDAEQDYLEWEAMVTRRKRLEETLDMSSVQEGANMKAVQDAKEVFNDAFRNRSDFWARRYGVGNRTSA
jgi:Arc/MetJ-type ribon-helix-helix transcriptional regulator